MLAGRAMRARACEDGRVSSALQMLGAAGEEIGAERFVERLALRDEWPAAERPRVVAAMIGSLDGHATVDGRAGGLGNPADRAVLRELRAAADALLVGPGTLIAERYATVLDPDQRERRERAGRRAGAARRRRSRARSTRGSRTSRCSPSPASAPRC